MQLSIKMKFNLYYMPLLLCNPIIFHFFCEIPCVKKLAFRVPLVLFAFFQYLLWQRSSYLWAIYLWTSFNGLWLNFIPLRREGGSINLQVLLIIHLSLLHIVQPSLEVSRKGALIPLPIHKTHRPLNLVLHKYRTIRRRMKSHGKCL